MTRSSSIRIINRFQPNLLRSIPPWLKCQLIRQLLQQHHHARIETQLGVYTTIQYLSHSANTDSRIDNTPPNSKWRSMRLYDSLCTVKLTHQHQPTQSHQFKQLYVHQTPPPVKDLHRTLLLQPMAHLACVPLGSRFPGLSINATWIREIARRKQQRQVCKLTKL